MECAEKIFDKLICPFVIWKRNTENDLLECRYTNGKLPNVKTGMLLSAYTKNSTYTRAIETKTTQTINNDSCNVYIEYINDDTICELHYPTCNNVKILSTISHKIRSPLMNIVGIIHILDEFKFNSEQKKYIEIIKRSSNDIISVANDIIDILNLEQNNINLKNGITSLKTITDSCLKIISNKNKKKSLTIKCKIEDNLPQKIKIDSVRLEQIIINLLNNSIDNMDSGQIVVTVSPFTNKNLYECPFEYQEIKEPYSNILFKIKDTGDGIDDSKKEVIESILDINNKTNDTKASYKLTGFGLYISKKICNLMNGHLWFRTEKDIGSIFYFNIICEGFFL